MSLCGVGGGLSRETAVKVVLRILVDREKATNLSRCDEVELWCCGLVICTAYMGLETKRVSWLR